MNEAWKSPSKQTIISGFEKANLVDRTSELHTNVDQERVKVNWDTQCLIEASNKLTTIESLEENSVEY